MALENLAAVLKSTGLPVTYLAWPEGEAPALPFLCHKTSGANPTFADGQVYYSYDDVAVELYTAIKDPALELKVEAALAGFHWKKHDTYISTERCFMITYDIEV